MFIFFTSVFSWGFCKMWQWVASTSRVYVIRVHPKAADGWKHLPRILSKTAQCHRPPKKSEKKITFPADLCGFRHLQCLKIVGELVHFRFMVFVSTIQVIFFFNENYLLVSQFCSYCLSLRNSAQKSHQFHHTQ